MLSVLRTCRPMNPRRKTPSLLFLLLLRRQAEVGLLLEGGITAEQVCRYVQNLRHEIEQERTLRIRGVKKPRRNPFHVGGSLRIGI